MATGMTIERERVPRKVLFPDVPRDEVRVAILACGHEMTVEEVEPGRLVQITAGFKDRFGWSRWEGIDSVVGATLWCHTCSEQRYEAALAARPATAAQVYVSRDEAIEAACRMTPRAEWGPIHRHGDKDYVQVYLGLHEMLAFDVLDLREVYDDPVISGAEIRGWGLVPSEDVRYALDDASRPIGPIEIRPAGG